jgi:hypothetical protein
MKVLFLLVIVGTVLLWSCEEETNTFFIESASIQSGDTLNNESFGLVVIFSEDVDLSSLNAIMVKTQIESENEDVLPVDLDIKTLSGVGHALWNSFSKSSACYEPNTRTMVFFGNQDVIGPGETTFELKSSVTSESGKKLSEDFVINMYKADSFFVWPHQIHSPALLVSGELFDGDGLQFVNVFEDNSISIMSREGDLIRQLDCGSIGNTNYINWDLLDDEGGRVSSGIYNYIVSGNTPYNRPFSTRHGVLVITK